MKCGGIIFSLGVLYFTYTSIKIIQNHHLQMSGCPLSSKDPPPEMEDRDSLDGEDDHFR